MKWFINAHVHAVPVVPGLSQFIDELGDWFSGRSCTGCVLVGERVVPK